MLDDEQILDLAAAKDVDMFELANFIETVQEDDDFASNASGINPAATVADSVRLDLFRILSNSFGPMLSVRRMVDLLKHHSITEQLALLPDAEARVDCIVAVYREMADEAITVVLAEEGCIDGLNAEDPRDYEEICAMTKRLRTLLAMRLGLA